MSRLGGFRQGPYRDLMKHSLIYGFGQVLTRITSIILLPLYTKYLRPTDYGVIAILDLVAGTLSILLGTGIVSAASRYHFEVKTEREQQAVWWTGLTLCVISATGILLPLMLLRAGLARITLGPQVANGGYYYGLILANLWFDVVGQLPDSYIKVRKKSQVSVELSLIRLVVNMALNVSFLVTFHLGVAGILLGNLISGVGLTFGFLVIVIRDLGAYSFHWPLLRQFWRFGGPLIVAAFLAMLMHQADRFFLRFFVSIEQIGIYSFAYTIGQGVNTLYVMPFSAIWGAVVYEIAHKSNARVIYVEVFQYFFYGLALVMLGVSLFARQLLSYIAAPDYAGAASLVPIICLAYLFYSLHEHFKVPVMLVKKTMNLLPAFVAATLTNVGMNFILIPRLGIAGAAWASVATFIVFSFVGLWRYRRIDRYEYPLLRCGAIIGGMVGSFLVWRWLGDHYLESSWGFVAAAAIWICWAIVLFFPLIYRFLIESPRQELNKDLLLPEQGVNHDVFNRE